MIAHLGVPAANAEAYEALMNEVAEMSRRHEPGVVFYEWSRSVDEPDTYVVIEVYRDGDAHAAHMATPWVTHALPKCAGLIAGRPHIRQYVSHGSAPVQRSVASD